MSRIVGRIARLARSGDPLAQWSVDITAQTLIAAGAPASKLVMGAPFYGRGWTGVTDMNSGLYQPATGPAAGTWEAGVEDYKVLATLTEEGFPRYWDGKAKVPWLFDGATFWTYDDPESLKHKTQYVRVNGLGGVMFWELSGDTSDGELISAIHEGLTQRPALITHLESPDSHPEPGLVLKVTNASNSRGRR